MDKRFIVNIDKASLESFIDDLSGIKSIRIASAFLSSYGADCLERLSKKENIIKENFIISIGKYFSNREPSGILEKLSKFATVKIVNFNSDDVFHAKICSAIKNDGTTICFIGSSNYTHGGLKSNFELNYILHPDKDEYDQLKLFFMSLDYKSTLINENIIANYLTIEDQLKELDELNKSAEQVINTVSSMNDPFNERHYDFNGQYFSFQDYECLFSRNAIEKNVSTRNNLQLKLLDINRRIYNRIQKLGIHHHWSDKHITSLAYPCIYNYFHVGWLGVRYGKSKQEIDALNSDADLGEDYEVYGFQKHGCIQYSLDPEYFSISIFHAVPHDAVDRYYLHENIIKNDFKNKLIPELANFEGSDYSWYIDDVEFKMQINKAVDFPQFYLENDRDGHFTYFRRMYMPDDKHISNSNIENTIIDEITRLVSLYNILVFRHK